MAEDKANNAGKENKRFLGGWRDKLYNIIIQPIIPFARKKMEEGYGVDQQSFYHQLNKEVNFANLGSRNQDLLRVEKAMGEVNQFKEDAMHLQNKVGPYSTWASVERERHLVREGFFKGEDFDDPKLLMKGVFLDLPIGKVTSKKGIHIEPKRFAVPLPKRRTVILEQFFHPPYRNAKDSMSYHYVSYFGEHRNDAWKKRYKKLLNQIFEGKDGEGKTLEDRYKEYIQGDNSTSSVNKEELKNKVGEGLKQMKKYYEVLIEKAFDHILDMERQMREDLDKVWQAHKNLQDIRKECFTEGLDHVKNLFTSPPLYNVTYPYQVGGNESITSTGASLDSGWPRELGGPSTDQNHHLSALHTSLFMFAQLDALRDDLRDGRSRRSSLSVMEYLMAQHQVKGFGKARLGERGWTMTNSQGNPLSGTKQPTQFNPAFDLRAKSSDFTYNKGKYFDVHSSASRVDAPLISTRGGAMYIVDRVMMSIGDWGEAKSMLKGIGNQTHGFDIGARPWDLFGERLPTDPFAVEKEKINVKPAKTKPRKLQEIT